MTIGTYEVPIWARKDWLVPLDDLGADYDIDDLLPAIRSGLSLDGKLYAAPFYGESSMIMDRKDLFDKAGIKMHHASRRIMAKLGMREEGVMRDNMFVRGEWWSTVQGAILSSDPPMRPSRTQISP